MSKISIFIRIFDYGVLISDRPQTTVMSEESKQTLSIAEIQNPSISIRKLSAEYKIPKSL